MILQEKSTTAWKVEGRDLRFMQPVRPHDAVRVDESWILPG
jgi:hypothetical protein